MLGSRLEEILQEEQSTGGNVTSLITDESTQRQLLQEDEEEDYLDEGSFKKANLLTIWQLTQRFTFEI
jgi:hypothetical protein